MVHGQWAKILKKLFENFYPWVREWVLGLFKIAPPLPFFAQKPVPFRKANHEPSLVPYSVHHGLRPWTVSNGCVAITLRSLENTMLKVIKVIAVMLTAALFAFICAGGTFVSLGKVIDLHDTNEAASYFWAVLMGFNAIGWLMFTYITVNAPWHMNK